MIIEAFKQEERVENLIGWLPLIVIILYAMYDIKEDLLSVVLHRI